MKLRNLSQVCIKLSLAGVFFLGGCNLIEQAKEAAEEFNKQEELVEENEVCDSYVQNYERTQDESWMEIYKNECTGEEVIADNKPERIAGDATCEQKYQEMMLFADSVYFENFSDCEFASARDSKCDAAKAAVEEKARKFSEDCDIPEDEFVVREINDEYDNDYKFEGDRSGDGGECVFDFFVPDEPKPIPVFCQDKPECQEENGERFEEWEKADGTGVIRVPCADDFFAEECPPGFYFDFHEDRCKPDDYGNMCEPGYFMNADGHCVKDYGAEGCPEGYYFNEFFECVEDPWAKECPPGEVHDHMGNCVMDHFQVDCPPGEEPDGMGGCQVDFIYSLLDGNCKDLYIKMEEYEHKDGKYDDTMHNDDPNMDDPFKDDPFMNDTMHTDDPFKDDPNKDDPFRDDPNFNDGGTTVNPVNEDDPSEVFFEECLDQVIEKTMPPGLDDFCANLYYDVVDIAKETKDCHGPDGDPNYVPDPDCMENEEKLGSAMRDFYIECGAQAGADFRFFFDEPDHICVKNVKGHDVMCDDFTGGPVQCINGERRYVEVKQEANGEWVPTGHEVIERCSDF